MFESLHEFLYRVRARFRRDELDAELAEELKAYAAFLEDEARATGASPDEARRAASMRLGNLTNIRERTRALVVWLGKRAAARYAVRVSIFAAFAGVYHCSGVVARVGNWCECDGVRRGGQATL